MPYTPFARGHLCPRNLTAESGCAAFLAVVTMSIHKLTAGSGYDYLTRQVAAFDATSKGHVGLASYYAARGESPGVWLGSGIAGIDGLQAGDPVTAEQMWALFGVGMHPLATQRLEQLADDELSDENIRAATRLGAPFKVRDVEPNRFQVEVARRSASHAGSTKASVWRDVRADLAREFFQAEHGRLPTDDRELAAAIAKLSRPPAQPVAGYDLTFSPVKSVSTLWAVADPQVAAVIERAHQAAVREALGFIETHALYAREGSQGVRQVNVRGLVAAAFTHRDSRAGDPDLHTHVAVANKVQTVQGRWLSIDGRVLFKAVVAASETYNTALEHHLRDRLGVRFAERSDLDTRKPAVREIVGVDPRLMARWSARRQDIKSRSAELSVSFQRDHGRPPTPVEALRLAQQATLETRQRKHEPRSLGEQRATWQAEAAETLGGPEEVRALINTALHRPPTPSSPADERWVSRTAGKVLAELEQRRSTWQSWHVRAEALRQVRAAEIQSQTVDRLVEDVVAEVLTIRSVSLAQPNDGISEPVALRRSDGSSVYTVAGSEMFTSARILAAEQRLVAYAGRTDGRTIDGAIVELALLEQAANGITLDTGQAALVRSMSMSGALLQLAIAPAGTGKTTALRALTRAWIDSGGQVLGLAPSAAAAAQLREQTGAPTETLAKLTWSIDYGDPPDWALDVGQSTLVIIDEAGMADTLSLNAAVEFIVQQGGSVRLIGDDQQLAAVGAGGVLRDIQAVHGADRLTELHRFQDPAEAAASLALREGRPEALGFYLDHQRIHVGDPTTTAEQLFTAWQADRDRGLDTIMLAPTRDLVAQLNQRARVHRLRDTSPGREVRLADGNQASAGDVIITRRNDRRLRLSATDWVKNGDRWTVLDVTETGALKVKQTRSGCIVTLPAGYVGTATQLGYASTVHTAQGVTVDTMHGIATGTEDRQLLYTMLTRGRMANHLYLPVVGDGDPHAVLRPENIHLRTATQLLETILARDGASRSASTLQREQRDPAVQLGDATARYVDALHIAAEHVAGPQLIPDLDHEADQLINGLTNEAAWPALRSRLLLLAADDTDPIAALRDAAQRRELDSAADRAAVLNRRLDDTGLRNPAAPLPWLPRIPSGIVTDPDWGPYLAARARLITDLADQVRTAERAPYRAVKRRFLPSAELVAEIQVWRAATRVEPFDLRPTGPKQPSLLARTWQRRLDKQLAAADIAQDQQWTNLLAQHAPNVIKDSFLPSLVDKLESLERLGFDAASLVRSAAAKGSLPDDHPAAALWWRILDEPPPQNRGNSEQPTPAMARPDASKFGHEPYRRTRGPRTHGPPPPR
jgi:conjugative relaxase-like TrwC/TraI family protein